MNAPRSGSGNVAPFEVPRAPVPTATGRGTFPVRLPNPGGVALVMVIAVGYGCEILFQPGVFANFSVASIVEEGGSIFCEYLIAGLLTLVAIDRVERHAARASGLYAMQLFAAVTASAAVGVGVWAIAFGQSISSESAPFLASEVLRLTSVGAFLAVTHGLTRRLRETRARQRAIELDAATTRAETEIAELRLLEAQIEPHFLFNTIANLRRTWHVDPSLGRRMHDNAIRYLEATLPRMRTLEATLRDELDLTRAYLELCALRMGHRLRFSIDVPPSFGDLPFPRMTLLTLVENSIRHGLTPSADGGTVTISAEADLETVTLRVADDGVGFGIADTAGTGIGLVNIRSRLQAQFGRRARLEIAAPEAGGVVASIRVPRAAAEAIP